MNNLSPVPSQHLSCLLRLNMHPRSLRKRNRNDEDLPLEDSILHSKGKRTQPSRTKGKPESPISPSKRRRTHPARAKGKQIRPVLSSFMPRLWALLIPGVEDSLPSSFPVTDGVHYRARSSWCVYEAVRGKHDSAGASQWPSAVLQNRLLQASCDAWCGL